jgi:hypothetical protein
MLRIGGYRERYVENRRIQRDMLRIGGYRERYFENRGIQREIC